MGELTYILGAGASYQSIPIVKTFPNRFEYFYNYIGGLTSDDFIRNNGQSKNCEELHAEIKYLNNEFKTHQSFDTYFKKLFHTGQYPQINIAKKILNIYFIWEHLENAKLNSEPRNTESTFWKQAKVDKRYDALIAGLLQPTLGVSKVYCKTNFISWNYDLNLLSSIKNYFYPTETHADFLTKIKSVNSSEFIIGDQISIINMNGYFYSKFFDDFKNLNDLDFRNILVKKLSADFFNDKFIDKDSQLIKFAWESNNDTADLVSNKIKNSKNIVIIGYTFPLYNRLLDLRYFYPSIMKSKKLYVQDPNALEIENSVLDDFELRDLIYLTNITNCDNFFVPSNIFRL